MTAPKWESGHLYLPGDLVQPITAPAPTASQVANGYFQDGTTGWVFSGLAEYSTNWGYLGNTSASIPGLFPGGSGSGEGVALNQTQLTVDPGGSLTAKCMIRQGSSDVGNSSGWVEVQWFTAAGVFVASDQGNIVNDGRSDAWKPSEVTSIRPASAAYALAGIGLFQKSGDEVNGDYLTVSGAQSGLPDGLVYMAVQDAAGMSAASEPAWPNTLGVTVIDNEVIWEAVATNRVTYTASPRYVSGETEPTWPTQPGGQVVDGTFQWEAISRHIEDENCPNTKVVAILSSKVFAIDRDIVRFSATANPLDWTSEQDAGYLPTGLQQANSNDMAVLAPYRGNLCPMNANCFQNWLADPDPSVMAILDQMDGVGSTWQQAARSVGNELFYLSALGVRTVGIANAAENLAAGDVGMPIDPLVQEALRVTEANSIEPLATYYPGAGQYWLAFPPPPPPPPQPPTLYVVATYSTGAMAYPWVDDSFGEALPAPVPMPTNVAWDAAFNPTATAIVIVQENDAEGVVVRAWKWSDTGFGEAYAAPVPMPPNDCDGVAFSPAGDVVALAHSGAPYISVYAWSDETGFGEKYADPSVIPGAAAVSVAFSHDGSTLLVGHSQGLVSAYQWDAATGFGTKYADPVSLPTGLGARVIFSPDDDAVVVAYNGHPYIAAWSWSAATGFGAKYANPAAIPGANAYDVSFSPDGTALAVGFGTSPNVYVYPWSAATGFGAKYEQPSTAVPRNATNVRFSPGGGALVVGMTSAPYLTAYTGSHGFGDVIAGPATLPPTWVYGLRFGSAA